MSIENANDKINQAAENAAEAVKAAAGEALGAAEETLHAAGDAAGKAKDAVKTADTKKSKTRRILIGSGIVVGAAAVGAASFFAIKALRGTAVAEAAAPVAEAAGEAVGEAAGEVAEAIAEIAAAAFRR